MRLGRDTQFDGDAHIGRDTPIDRGTANTPLAAKAVSRLSACHRTPKYPGRPNSPRLFGVRRQSVSDDGALTVMFNLTAMCAWAATRNLTVTRT